MKRLNLFKYLFLTGIVLTAFNACTDLEVEEKDSLVIETESGEFGGVDPSSSLASAYTDLRGFGDQANWYALAEVTSDELLVPTRGTDWGDNGIWRTLHQHSWDPTHQYILNTWNNLNSNVFRLNQLLHPLSGANQTQAAEGKFLRAFNMFWLLDMFGKLPFREADQGVDVDPTVLTSQEAFDFILKDLQEALPDLPQVGPGTETIGASKAAAHFLLAKLYLNKHVYLGTTPEPEDMNQVIDHVNAITEDGFEIQDGYFEIFTPDPDSETILWTDASWGNRIWNGLHYFQNAPDNTGGGWNGFSTTADFYALFEGNPDDNTPAGNQEERRGYVPTDGDHLGIGYGFLVGQQYDEEGNPLNDRAGNPLVYTKEFPGLAGNNERTGIRVIKYHPENGAFTNHYIFFRYADAFLMKIEAILRGGSSDDDPLELINELREIRKASPLTSVDLGDILDERGRELYIEGWRRNDQIRFGTFTETWDMKDIAEPHRVLFPIPDLAIATNPNLEQNPGY
ncbi:MAG: RagB/SusD family nutrient uptake outer membrane protein [Candidatus Cyclobacteriaceae bacterium M3_2C_046]